MSGAMPNGAHPSPAVSLSADVMVTPDTRLRNQANHLLGGSPGLKRCSDEAVAVAYRRRYSHLETSVVIVTCASVVTIPPIGLPVTTARYRLSATNVGRADLG